MIKALKIKVGAKTYPIKFGYGVTRELGEKWGLDGLLPVFQKTLDVLGVSKLEAKTTDVDALDKLAIGENLMKFSALETIADITSFGIANAKGIPVDELPFDTDSLIDALVDDIVFMTEIYTAFILTMPRPKEGQLKGDSSGKGMPSGARGKTT